MRKTRRITATIGKTLILVFLSFVLLLPTAVNSMSDAQRRIFDLGIPYYDVDSGESDDDTSTGADPCIPGGGSSNLPDEALAKIQAVSFDFDGKLAANKSAYEAGAADAGIHWSILAAIHYREAGMDPNRSIADGEPLGSGISIDGQPIGDTLEEDAKIAAQKAKSMARSVYGVELTENTSSMDDLGKTFLAYNRGYMYQDVDEPYINSPYVMNYYDADHIAMKWVRADSWFRGTQMNRVEGTTDSNVGALAIYAYITGSSFSAPPCIGDPGPDSDLSLGGMTIEQAVAYMNTYENGDGAAALQHGYWNDCRGQKDNDGNFFYAYGSKENAMANCVAVVKDFIVNFMVSHNNVALPPGGGVVRRLVNSAGWELGNTPKPYAVFSTGRYGGCTRSESCDGHTGLVLGVEENQIIVFEEGCGRKLHKDGGGWVGVNTYPMSEATSLYIYAYPPEGSLK